jgi:hypothetical protein
MTVKWHISGLFYFILFKMIFAGKRPTEPFSFICLKKLCSFLLIIILLYYTYDQFSQFSESISKPNVSFRKQHVDDIYDLQTTAKDISIIMLICGPIENCTYKSYEGGNKECEKADRVFNDHLTINPPNCSNSTSYYIVYQKETEIKITPNINEAYLNGIKIFDNTYEKNFLFLDISDSLYLVNNQINVVYYSPTIITQMTSKYAYGLAGGKEDNFVDFNVHMDHITNSTIPNMTTIISLRPISMDIYYQEETYCNRNYLLFLIFREIILFKYNKIFVTFLVSMILSSIGGFFGSLSGIFVFLFGGSKLAPW